MSTGSTTRTEQGREAASPPGRSLPRLRNASIRTKLALILVVPVTAVLALAGLRLLDVGREAYDAGLVRGLTSLSTEISDLGHYLHRERMSAAELRGRPGAAVDTYTARVSEADERINSYAAARAQLEDVPAAVQTRLQRIDDHLRTLNATRTAVLDGDRMAVSEVVLRYGVIITDLIGYSEVLGQVAGEGAVVAVVAAPHL